ncbi:MAG: hypothetical protein M1835_002653 [Candelina submexicana]|nr:MAG: hypothetical protein M1835_002653 [Candelina submexicana]
MAKNLRAKIPKSDTLVISDLNVDATKRFVDEVGNDTHIEIAQCVRAVAEKSETIITVLPEPSHVKSVFHGMLTPELPKSDKKGERLFIDCSTIDPASSKEVANAVHCPGIGRFVDAPMSGGVVGARAGTLTFMLGAPAAVLDRVKSVLLMMGKRVFHLGGQGAGVSGKIANNYLLALNNIATAEAMNIGVKWGLDAHILASLINASTGKCWPSEVNNPVPGVVPDSPASKGYSGGFGVSLMSKDLKLAIAAAKESGARLELAERATQIYDALEEDEDFKSKDFSVVYQYLQR